MLSMSLVVMAAQLTAAAGDLPREADLIGYGRLRLAVADETAGGIAEFTCQTPSHADQLLSKLRADFTWDSLTGPGAITLAGGVPAIAAGSGRVLIFARKDNRVYAIAAASAASAASLLASRQLDGKEARFLPERRHPLSLDFFDLRSLSFYYLAMNVQDLAKGLHRYDREVLAQPAAFWAPFHFGYSMFNPYFGLDELADGAAHFFPLQYCIAQAKAHDSVFMTHLGTYEAPWWIRNRFPQDIVGWDPHAISGWGPLGAMAGAHLSQHASDEAYAYAQRFTTAAIERTRAEAGEQLGCFRVVGGGHPGDEMGLHHLSTEFMDYDQAGQRRFRRWLQETHGVDLAALGRRWYDDPRHFRSWDEVSIPSHFEFFGGFGHGTFDLLEDWLWRPDSPAAESEGWHKSDYRPGDEWTPTDLAPSMKQLFLWGSQRDKQLRQGTSTVAWYRKEFDVSQWLKRSPGGEVYLVAQVGDKRNEPVEVFFNDAYLGPIRPKTVQDGPIGLRATSLIKPGRNVVCLKTKGGLIRGPVFLTREEPRRYPYLGKLQNARWVDLRDWTAQKLILGWKREASLARHQEPDLPQLFCPGSFLGFSDQFLDLKRQLGIASIHFTGGGSGYMPWWPGLGYVLGTYGTSEEGGTIDDPALLSRELAWMLLNGQGHHNYYYSAVDCMRIEQRTGWFTRNRRLLELVGKATWQKPPVAVLRAAHSDLYFPYDYRTNAWDVGSGPLQAAHYQNVYVTEAEIKSGLADDYPVIFDADTRVVDDDLLAGIQRYVRAGGTFVAVSDSGRHSLLEADAWPIERLTGFKVLGPRENRRLTIAAGNPLLTRLAGMSFDGDGNALQQTGAEGQGTVLARWDDGSAAVAMRTLGRGRIVVLGSSFWRNTSLRTATGAALPQSIRTTFFGDLFTGLGIARQADIDSEDVWVRRLVTKNGLQQWMMVYNAGRAPQKRLVLSFPLRERPPRVVDVVSGKPVEFAWENGTVRVSGLDLDVNAFRVLGVDTAAGLAPVRYWFAEKQHYQSRPSQLQEFHRLPSPPPTAVVMDKFHFRQPEAASAEGLAWLTEPTDGPGWKQVGYGFWDEMGYAARGTGYYRRSLRVPDSWHGHRVLLAFVSFDYPVFLEDAEVYVNGHAAGEYRGHAWSNFDVLDITPHLHPGENALALRVQAKEVRGGYIGQLVAFPLENLESPLELKQDWKLYSDNCKFAAASLPLDAAGRHLETDVVLPAAWKGKPVLLEFEVADRWVGCVVVNGRVIAYNQSLHPYPNIMQVNLQLWAKAGEKNRIELWPRTPETTPRQRMIVKSVRLGLQAVNATAGLVPAEW